MDRDTAVQRINDGLGFRPAGNPLTDKIILRLQEAQRDLEKGKTLPQFLLQEDQPLALAAAAHTVAKPTGFLRESDIGRIHYTPTNSTSPIFLERKYFDDATLANTRIPVEPRGPKIYVIRRTVIDFITVADRAYTLTWDYYKAADLLTTNIENSWLLNAPEWLIGEAGLRLARDLRDKTAIELFTDILTRGRAATFGEDLAAETASGPLIMGANN